jgi:hypothetical protein
MPDDPEKTGRGWWLNQAGRVVIRDVVRPSEETTVSDWTWPRTWKEFIPATIWAVIVLGFGLEFVARLVSGEYGRALFALCGLGVSGAMVIHGAQVRSRLYSISPNWIIPALLVFLLAIILSPFVEEKRWPFSAWFPPPVVAHGQSTTEQNHAASLQLRAPVYTASEVVRLNDSYITPILAILNTKLPPITNSLINMAARLKNQRLTPDSAKAAIAELDRQGGEFTQAFIEMRKLVIDDSIFRDDLRNVTAGSDQINAEVGVVTSELENLLRNLDRLPVAESDWDKLKVIFIFPIQRLHDAAVDLDLWVNATKPKILARRQEILSSR